MNRRWFSPRTLRVPTAKVAAAPPCCPITTEVTVLKAFLPLVAEELAAAKRKISLIGLPSMLYPLTVTTESRIREVVPPGVTIKALGTSGWVIPAVTVTGEVAALVAAKIAVEVPAATFLEYSV